MIKISSLKTAVVLSVIALVGCESRTEQVQVKMQDIRSQAPLPVQPPPEFTPVPNYSYAGYQLKSPFIPSSLADELRVMAGKRVYPNLSRPLQPLENFALEDLVMKGTLRDRSGNIQALVKTPAGDLEKVQKGSYLGQNHGRIVNIDPNQMELIEIVPDGQDGYIERPRVLILHGSGA